MAFLSINKAERVVTGLVYQPDTLDLDSEFTTADEIRKAMHSWAERGRRLTVNHGTKQYRMSPVEFFEARADYDEGRQKVRKGSWVLAVRVRDDAVWQAIERGDLRGFSMGGRATKEDATIGGHSVEEVLEVLLRTMAGEFAAAGIRDEQALTEELAQVDWRAEVRRVAEAVDPSAPVEVLLQALDDE